MTYREATRKLAALGCHRYFSQIVDSRLRNDPRWPPWIPAKKGEKKAK